MVSVHEHCWRVCALFRRLTCRFAFRSTRPVSHIRWIRLRELFVAVGIFVFDFQLFTGELVRKRKGQRLLSSQLLDIPGVLFHAEVAGVITPRANSERGQRDLSNLHHDPRQGIRRYSSGDASVDILLRVCYSRLMLF